MEMATPSLLGLPAELIVKIIDDIQPGDHLNFALVSRRLYQISGDVLKSHRRWHESTSLSSDLHPLTVPQLLENIFLDPIAAWHLRDLEFWRLRRSWNQWIIEDPVDEADISTDSDREPELLVDKHQPGRSAYVFTDNGVDRLRDCFTTQLGYSEAVANVSVEQIMRGEEEPLKLLLVALAPGLRSLKFPNLFFGSRNRR